MLDICNKYLLNMHVNPPSPRAACDTSVVLIERARASKGISIYNLNYKRPHQESKQCVGNLFSLKMSK